MKDSNGIYIKPPAEPKPNPSIDDVMLDGLINTKRIMDGISAETSRSGVPARSTVQSLKDCMTLLLELKKHEKELLKQMSDEELKRLIKTG